MNIYLYNEMLRILETETQGIIIIDDIISHYTKIMDDSTLPRNLKVLIDCRGTQFDIEVGEISLTKDVVKKALLKYNSIKEAILVDEPYETVVATLFKQYNLSLESHSFSIFCTERAARNWLFQTS